MIPMIGDMCNEINFDIHFCRDEETHFACELATMQDFPLRIEDFLPSEAMEFYLGPTHWLDAFPEILDVHLDKIVNIFTGMGNVATDTKREGYSIVGPELIRIADIGKIGMDYTALTMKEMEIDYLCIPSDRYEMNDETEGTFDDWKQSAKEYENDTSILLVKNDEVIGYCDMYPVMEEAYNDLITGKVIIRDSMIDLFCMGGVFDVYIAMVTVGVPRNMLFFLCLNLR